MNVLVTADCVGGVWTYALELTRALAARDVDVTIAVLGGRLTCEQRRELREAPAARAYAADFALEWMPDPWADVQRASSWLLEIADAADADVVHLNQFAFGALPWGRPCVVVGHSDVLSWHESVRGRAAPRTWARYEECVRAGIAAADALVAPTRAMLDALKRHYGPHPRALVIVNGRAVTPPQVPRERLVLTAGRLWDEAKNAALLWEVAPRLPCQLAFAGQGFEGDIGAPPANVLLLGRLARAELDTWLARAAIYASAARYEPFGLAALEAAQCGCALVLGELPSQREIWGDAATYVPPDDADALETALRSLLGDDARRASLAARAEARARELTPQRMANAYLELYEELVAETTEAVTERAAVAR